MKKFLDISIGLIWDFLTLPIRVSRIEDKLDLLIRFCPECKPKVITK
jgi:hypothetical protein